MTIAYERQGSGEPLVLLHGIGSRAAAWTPVTEIVAADREVFTVDTPGFGGSAGEPLPDPPSIPGFAAAFARFFERIGLDRPHVAGNSMGGAIVLELVRMKAVRSATVFSPVGFGGAISKHWERVLLRGSYEGARLSRRLNPEAGPRGWRAAAGRPVSFLVAYGRPSRVPDEELWEATLSLAGADGFLDALPYVRGYRLEDPGQLGGVPLTIAWGRRDVLLNWRVQSRRARRLLPWARHVDLPGCGHVPFYDDPELCARVLLDRTGG